MAHAATYSATALLQPVNGCGALRAVSGAGITPPHFVNPLYSMNYALCSAFAGHGAFVCVLEQPKN